MIPAARDIEGPASANCCQRMLRKRPRQRSWQGLMVRCSLGLIRELARTVSTSYSIHLVHPFVLTAPRLLNFGLTGDGTMPPSQPWLYASIQFVVAAAGGVVVYVGIERPITRALRRAWQSAS